MFSLTLLGIIIYHYLSTFLVHAYSEFLLGASRVQIMLFPVCAYMKILNILSCNKRASKKDIFQITLKGA